MQPLISVIVPVYNVEPYVRRCVESVLKQSYKHFEILLIDDGSTDGSASICEELAESDSRIRVFHKHNGGLSDARNYGLGKAKGELVSFVDSDDAVHRDYLQTMFDDMVRFDADMAITSLQSLKASLPEPDLESNKIGIANAFTTEAALQQILYGHISVSACGKVYKRYLFSDISFPVGMHYEDVLTSILITMKCSKVTFRDVALYYYFMRDDSISHEPLTKQSFDRFTLAEMAAQSVCERYGELLSRPATRYLVVHALSVLRLSADNEGEYQERLKDLQGVVRKNQGIVLTDSQAPFRDKAGIIASMAGRHFYLLCWKLYSQFTGR